VESGRHAADEVPELEPSLAERVVPFVGVCLATAGLTASVFRVPAEPQVTVPTVSGAPMDPGDPARPAAEPAARPAQRPPEPDVPLDERHTRLRREAANDVLSRALRSLDTETAAHGPSTTDPTAPGTHGEGTAAALLDATSALNAAIRASREARSAEDLENAEELMRKARLQMQAACASGAGPLCESARQIESLGY
jgi:hypothetical protein